MEPSAQHRFQAGTAAMARSPVNSVCHTYTFRCGDCDQVRSQAGRRSRGYKRGFRCAGCVAARAAAKAARTAEASHA